MKKTFYICVAVLLFACREKYIPPFTAPAKGFLVVEGVVNSGQGATSIKLSRSVPLADSSRVKFETKALVRVEGEDNSSYALTEGVQGTYAAAQLTLKDNVRYRLYIKTSEGKEYLSDFAKPIKTPPIDNIRWEQPQDLTLFINTHDPQNVIRYYKWEYEETWEFHSAYLTQLKYLLDRNNSPYAVDFLYPNQDFNYSIATCWQSEVSNKLLIGSSIKLSKDSIDLPIQVIPHASWKLSVLYTIKVKQNALSKDGYEFLQRMKKNTESTGTLFDAQPSELVGNIHCKTDASEIVVGFVEVADIQEKRIWIRSSELTDWGYGMGCQFREIPNIPDSVRSYAGLAPATMGQQTANGGIATYNATDWLCVDCTLRGTNIRPSFWP